MIERKLYLQRILPFVGKNLIKIITGQRRVGKSFFLKQIRNYIQSQWPERQIIYINKEDIEFDQIRDYKDLVSFVQSQQKSPEVVLMIDEVQEIKEFQRALRHFLVKDGYDIYCTGSNASLLSSDIATLLSGRSIEIEMFSLSYPEFLEFHKLEDSPVSFNQYLMYGGMPNLIHFQLEDDIVYEYLRNLYNTIIVKDVIWRHNIRNVSFLQNLSLFVAENLGSIISAKKISDYLKSQQINLSPAAVQDYLLYLTNAFFIHRVKRSDLQGKKIFEIGEKYYFNDIGMRNALVGYKIADISKLLENIVFLHLKIAGYDVTVGKFRDKEIDFVARKKGDLLYIQVAYLLESQETIDREFGNLLKIKNSYPKFVISMDASSKTSYYGIKHLNIRQFCVDILKS